MQFLDVRNVDASAVLEERSPDGPLPPFLRKVGVFPDQDRMLIGDLVLIAPHAPKPHQVAITGMQSRRYDADHAQWTHAAIYIGEGKLCEATTKGVVVSELIDLFSAYSVRFRRIPDQSDIHRFKIAIGALREMTKPYGWKSIPRFMKEVWGKGPGSLFQSEATSGVGIKDSHICSALYCEAFHFATNTFPVRSRNFQVCPADLSICNAVADVELKWLRIPGGTKKKHL